MSKGRSGVHGAAGSWSASRQDNVPRSTLPVYGRQLFPELLLGETLARPEGSGDTLFENDGVRLWTLPAVDAGIGIISFKSKMHAIGDEVLDGVLAALMQAATSLDGLVIWHEAPFAVGANLKQISDACVAGDFDRLEQTVTKFQQATMALKLSLIHI